VHNLCSVCLQHVRSFVCFNGEKISSHNSIKIRRAFSRPRGTRHKIVGNAKSQPSQNNSLNSDYDPLFR
jgi:hypothetical protein